VPTLQDILDYLRKRGRQLDSELAEAIGIPLVEVRLRLAELANHDDAHFSNRF
jgi:hypothetical protein